MRHKGLFVCLEGVKDVESILRIILPMTEKDILYAPGILGISVIDKSESEIFLNDPGLCRMEDTPEGFWTMDLVDYDEFLDKVEYSSRFKRAWRFRK